MLSYGCISIPKQASIIDVPFISQEQTNHCGVIALAMAFDYYNITYSLTNLIDEAFIPALNGSPLELIANTANQYGLNASIDFLSVESLQLVIAAKNTPIIYLSPIDNSDIGHFAILTGISSDGKKMRIHKTDLSNQWQRSSKLNRRSNAGLFPTVTISKPIKKLNK